MISIKKFFIELWNYRRAIIIILTPILLIPFLIHDRSKENAAAYILCLMAVYWVTEAIPLAVTSLFPVFLAPMLGVLPASEIAVQYLTNTNMLFVGSLMVATAMEHQNLHRRIALLVLRIVGSDPRMLFVGFMLPSWFLSMWISNTSSTAMMIPIVQAVLSEIQKGNLPSAQYENPALDVETALDEPTMVTTPGPQARETIMSDKNEDDHYPSTQRLRRGLCLSVAHSATCGGITTLTGSPPNLICYGILQNLYGSKSGLNFGTWMMFALPMSVVLLIIVWIVLLLIHIGYRNCISPKTNRRKDQMIKEIIRNESKKLGPMTFGEISCFCFFLLLIVLWLSREPGVHGWNRAFLYDGIVYVKDTQPAVLIAVILMIWPARNPFNRQTEEFKAYGSGVLVPWKVIEQRFPWGILILMGGGLALAEICKVSGFSKMIAEKLLFLGDLHPTLIVIILALSTSFLTEVTSNTATASILLPIVIPLAVCIGVNPLFLALPVTIACSFAFCLPVATPPNAIVFSKDSLKVIHMIKSGILLNFSGVAIIIIATITYATAMFDLYTLPKWAGSCNSTVSM